MGRFCQIAKILISIILLSSCEKVQENQKEKTLIDSDTFSYSIEEEYIKYTDSINMYTIEKQNIPKFITEYYKEFDDVFKNSYVIHYPTPDSRRRSVYTRIFFKSKPEKLELIKAELIKKEILTNLDSLIINTIDYVVSKKKD